MHSNRHRCPFSITLQIRALRTLPLLLVFSLTRLSRCCILVLLSLCHCSFFVLFFALLSRHLCSLKALVFHEFYVFPPLFHLASDWIPQLPLSGPTFLQIVLNIPCLQDFSTLDILSQPHRVKEKVRLDFQIIFTARDLFYFSICCSHSWVLKKQKNRRLFLNEFC